MINLTNGDTEVGVSNKNVENARITRARGIVGAGRNPRTRCSYCGGEFKCTDCGKRYRDCKCRVYQSGHTKCHRKL